MSGKPNRTKGLIVGLIGGAVGEYAVKYYRQHIEPDIFGKDTPPQLPSPVQSDPVEERAPFAPYYRAGEDEALASARLVYDVVVKQEIKPEEKASLSETLQWVYGITMGGLYGGTRTTTRPRDIAGGFFYGIRLFLGHTFGFTLLGLRPGPTRFKLEQHVRLLVAYWVYSFVTTAVTRLLYRLLSPEDWGISRRK